MKLKAWRIDRGLTQAEFAEAISVRTSAVSRYESGRVPGPEIVARIYLATGGRVQPGDFYNLPEVPDPEAADAVVAEAPEADAA